jgi:tetratricopeptide (TPR) repeat protein
VLNNLGVLYTRLGSLDLAEKTFLSALAIAANSPRSNHEAFINGQLGYIYMTLGDMRRAEAFLEKGVRLTEEAGDAMISARMRRHLGTVRRNQGDANSALETTARCFPIFLSQVCLARNCNS